ncbi:MAG: HD domain-containing protein [Patescibacteria group bacterium]
MEEIKIPKTLFDKFSINSEWFKREPFSMHGILHEYRVLIFAFLIGTREGADVDALCYASIFHDTQRNDDGFDLEHADRAAEWVNKFDIPKFNIPNIEKIKNIIKWHTPSDKDIPDLNLDIRCFKDADALDRWRIGDLDIKYLRTETARELLDFSKKLFSLTDSKKQVIKDPKENIIASLLIMGVLY